MDKEKYKVIEEALKLEIAAILSQDIGAIDPETPLHEMGLDSLGFVELLVIMENKFNIKLMESGLTKNDFKTIKALSLKIKELI
ncbi:MAG: acyl carrier protein [Pseudomonadota bacterium]